MEDNTEFSDWGEIDCTSKVCSEIEWQFNHVNQYFFLMRQKEAKGALLQLTRKASGAINQLIRGRIETHPGSTGAQTTILLPAHSLLTPSGCFPSRFVLLNAGVEIREVIPSNPMAGFNL